MQLRSAVVAFLLLLVVGLCCASSTPAAENLLRNGSFEGSTKYWAEDGDLVQDVPAHGSFCVKLREKGSLRSGSIRIL